MANPPAVLMVELIMSIDRMIASAQTAKVYESQWAPQVILGHVSQVDQLVWIPRIETMVAKHELGDSPPEFAWWEPDPIATEQMFADKSIEEVSALAMANRTQLLTKVRDLTPEQWQAQGLHATFGKIDISALLIEVLTHDEEHRASLVS